VTDPIHVISLGAGVQSSTMALMAAKGEITPMPSLAIFADVQAEPESVYRYLAWLEKELAPHFPVVRVTQGNLEADSLRRRISKVSGKNYVSNSVPFWVKAEDGSRGPTIRKCTRDYKLTPIFREVKRLVKKGHRLPKKAAAMMWLGISTDEAHRMKDSMFPYMENRYPLIEARMSRAACLAWMERNGYPKPPRSACVFCPYHSADEWLRLKTEEPADFARAVRFEEDLQTAYREHDAVIRGTPYLWDGLVSIRDADFAAASKTDTRQLNLFGAECEGMCGV
jgi:hypothetical protein